MGAKGQRQGWQRHSVDEYKDFMDDYQYEITAPIDPELEYPNERDISYVTWEEYFEHWEQYQEEGTTEDD
jgi:hypothetical protein